MQVFRDGQQVANAIMDVNETRSIRADLDGASELSIRVTCELPSPVVVLTDAGIA